MIRMKMKCLRVTSTAGVILLLITFNAFAAGPKQNSEPPTPAIQAWVGARIIDGTGKPAIENARTGTGRAAI